MAMSEIRSNNSDRPHLQELNNDLYERVAQAEDNINTRLK